MNKTLTLSILLTAEAGVICSVILGFLLRRSMHLQRALRVKLAEYQQALTQSHRSRQEQQAGLASAPPPSPPIPVQAELQPQVDEDREQGLTGHVALLAQRYQEAATLVEQLRAKHAALQQVLEPLQAYLGQVSMRDEEATQIEGMWQEVWVEVHVAQEAGTHLQECLEGGGRQLTAVSNQVVQVTREQEGLQLSNKELQSTNVYLAQDVERKERMLREYDARVEDEEAIRRENERLRDEVVQLRQQLEALTLEYQCLHRNVQEQQKNARQRPSDGVAVAAAEEESGS